VVSHHVVFQKKSSLLVLFIGLHLHPLITITIGSIGDNYVPSSFLDFVQDSFFVQHVTGYTCFIHGQQIITVGFNIYF